MSKTKILNFESLFKRHILHKETVRNSRPRSHVCTYIQNLTQFICSGVFFEKRKKNTKWLDHIVFTLNQKNTIDCIAMIPFRRYSGSNE